MTKGEELENRIYLVCVCPRCFPIAANFKCSYRNNRKRERGEWGVGTEGRKRERMREGLRTRKI